MHRPSLKHALLIVALSLPIAGCSGLPGNDSLHLLGLPGEGHSPVEVRIAVPAWASQPIVWEMPDGSSETAGGRPQRLIFVDRPELPCYVLLTNRSSETVRLWPAQCVFGDCALSFELVNSDGRKHRITKKLAGSGKIGLVLAVEPGETVPWTFALTRDNWNGLPMPMRSPDPGYPAVGAQSVRMRARYGNAEQEHGVCAKFGIWTGLALSEWGEYILVWPGSVPKCPSP